jgi:hypothetical protein
VAYEGRVGISYEIAQSLIAAFTWKVVTVSDERTGT